MSDIFNSPSGVREHHTDIKSGLVNKDKSTYTQQVVKKQLLRNQQLYRKCYIEQQNENAIDDGYYNMSFDQDDEYYSKNQQQNTAKITHSDYSDIVSNESGTADNEAADNESGMADNEAADNESGMADNEAADNESGIADNEAADNESGMADNEAADNESGIADNEAIDNKNNIDKIKQHKSNQGSKFKKVARHSTKITEDVVVGTSFLVNSQSYQSDTGEDTVRTIDRATKSAVHKIDSFTAKTAKSKKSRYFRTSAKASDSVKSGKNPGRFVKSVSSSKKAFAKGINAVDSVIINPIVRIAGDDIGSQTMVKTVEVAQYSVRAARVTARTTKAAVKTTGKAVRYTARATKKTAQATKKAAQVTARVTVSTAKAVVATVSKIIALIAANPVAALIIAAVVLIFILIIMLCSSIMSIGSISSYGGAGDNQDTVSLNDYLDVYDYANQAIATRCRDLFNIHNTATGYLRYNYNYEIENEDGSISTTNTYPVADIAPIMAYLAVNYQNYTLTNEIKSEIDNLVEELYTYTWKTAPYSYTIDHGSGDIETISGSQLTLTIRYHNAAKYFEENNIFPQEKMAVYNSIKSYGDISYFRMYNILKTENWHEWISSQYGYGLDGTLVHKQYADNIIADITEYSLIQQDYISLSYKNSSNESIDQIYSPLNGTVTSIIEDDNYDVILTIKDSENNLEFTVMAEFADSFTPTVSVGSVVTAGQLIANNSYSLDFKCKSNGVDINPLLLMEYYQHS